MSFRLVTKQELFNLQRACAHNTIEWISPARGAIHNFICIHDPDKINEIALEYFDREGTQKLAVGPASATERAQAMEKHDRIIEAM
jgi:hypothetical protein